jgi:GH35 family endo-1,4-beta-xylanase
MLQRIDALRWYAVEAESNHFMEELSDKIYEFDQNLQVALNDRYGDRDLRKMVPEWHKLVGSTVEDHDVNPEAKKYIADEVERFVSEMETKWELIH